MVTRDPRLGWRPAPVASSERLVWVEAWATDSAIRCAMSTAPLAQPRPIPNAESWRAV
jgi:hypothetical protein